MRALRLLASLVALSAVTLLEHHHHAHAAEDEAGLRAAVRGALDGATLPTCADLTTVCKTSSVVRGRAQETTFCVCPDGFTCLASAADAQQGRNPVRSFCAR